MSQHNMIHSTASLHIISQPPSQWDRLATHMKAFVKTGDAIVLLGDACNALNVILHAEPTISQLMRQTLSQFFTVLTENPADITSINWYMLTIADNARDDRVIYNMSDLNDVSNQNESTTNTQGDHLAFNVMSHHTFLQLSHTHHSVIRW